MTDQGVEQQEVQVPVLKSPLAEEIAESCKGIAGQIIEENKDLEPQELGKKVLQDVLSEINLIGDHAIHQVNLTVYDIAMSSLDPRMPNAGQPKVRRKERYILPMLVTNKQFGMGNIVKIHPLLDQIGKKPTMIIGVHHILYDQDRHPKVIELAKEFIEDYDGYDKFRNFIEKNLGWEPEAKLLAKIQKNAENAPTPDKSAPEDVPEDEPVDVDPPKPTLVEEAGE